MTADLQSQIEHFNALIAEGAPAHVYSKLAEAYRRVGKLDDASRTARVGLERHPGSLAIQEALGLILLDMGQSEAAVRALAGVVEKLPDNSVASISLAIALSRIDRVADATNVLKRRIEKDPLDRQAANLLRKLESKGAGGMLDVPAPPATPVAAPKPIPAPTPAATAPVVPPTTAAAVPTPTAPVVQTRPAEPEYDLPIPDAPVRPEMEFVVKPLSELFKGFTADDNTVEPPEGLDGFFDENPRPLEPIAILDQDETSTTWTMTGGSAENGSGAAPASAVPHPVESSPASTPADGAADSSDEASSATVGLQSGGEQPEGGKGQPKRGWWSRFWRRLFRKDL